MRGCRDELFSADAALDRTHRLNLALILIVAAIGFGLGFAQGLGAQHVILYTVITVAVLFLLLNYVTLIFESRGTEKAAAVAAEADPAEPGGLRAVWRGQPRAHHGDGRCC